MLQSSKIKYEKFRENINKWLKLNIDNKKINKLSLNLFENLIKDSLYGFQYTKNLGEHDKDYMYHAIAIEEISKLNPYISMSIITNYLFCLNILIYGNKLQNEKYLNSVKFYKKNSSIGILDNETDTSLENINTYVEYKDSYYILNGKKFCESNIIDADYFFIVAKNKKNEFSVFILEKELKGLSIKLNNKNLTNQGYIYLNNVKVSKENLLGLDGDGKKIIHNLIINSYLSLSAQYNGISYKLYNDYLYLIHNYPILFAQYKTNIKAGQLLIYSACEFKNSGYETAKKSAMAKLYNSNLTKTILNEFINLNIKSNKITENLIKLKNYNFNNIYNTDIENISHIINKKNIIKNENKIKYTSVQIEHRLQKIFNSPSIETNVLNFLKDIDSKLNLCKIKSYDIYSDIEKSSRVISFGLGIGDKENIKNIEKLSKLICASIGCTLPIAEELNWLPIDRYIGSDGKKFNGELYFSIGITGSKQHLEGIVNANTIVAINNDKHSPIFSICDYGIVGDINEIVKILVKQLSLKLK